jgi:hypothetical protein
MNKSLLSQLLDGAAFPAIILAVAVSQIKLGPHHRKTPREGQELAAEVQAGSRVEPKAQKTLGH